MRRQKKSIGEIVVALSELNLPRESRSFLFRYALQHHFAEATRSHSLSLQMSKPDYGDFGDPGMR